jgi:hypothetical protein
MYNLKSRLTIFSRSTEIFGDKFGSFIIIVAISSSVVGFMEITEGE